MVKRIGNKAGALPNRENEGVREVTRPFEPLEVDTENGFVVREQLSTLISSKRRPPGMQLNSSKPANNAVAGEISEEGLAILGAVRSDVLAFHISALTMRLAQMEKDKLTTGQKRGIHSVNELTRMFEQLHILRTSQQD